MRPELLTRFKPTPVYLLHMLFKFYFQFENDSPRTDFSSCNSQNQTVSIFLAGFLSNQN